MNQAKKNGRKKVRTSLTVMWKVKSISEVRKALQQRDSLAVERYSDEREACRMVVLAMNGFIRGILTRPDIKRLPKPGAAVVRALIIERGMTTFTANRHWNEFCLVGLDRSRA